MTVKDSVLTILEQNRGKSCSGEEIAEKLCVTRAAVWKAVKSLISDGYDIDSCRSKGYTLSEKSDILTEQSIRAHLPEKYKNIKITALDTVDSTNTYAKSLISAGETQTVLIAAAEQTGGRGRRGKSFFSPKGKGIYFSVILHPKMTLSATMLLTVAAAVAVSRVVDRISGNTAEIKWVNDVFCGGKKICGILSEAVCDMESGTIESIVVGIGVNLSSRTEDFPEEIRAVAGSVFPHDITRSQIVGEITSELLTLSENLSDPQLISEYKKRLFILGQEIEYMKNGVKKRGMAEDVNSDGNLIVSCADGRDVLSSGEVSLNSAAFAGRRHE